VGALALTGTKATAAYQPILTAGLNIDVLELIAAMEAFSPSFDSEWAERSGSLTPVTIPVESLDRAD
jgi:hypothetical protein